MSGGLYFILDPIALDVPARTGTIQKKLRHGVMAQSCGDMGMELFLGFFGDGLELVK